MAAHRRPTRAAHRPFAGFFDDLPSALRRLSRHRAFTLGAVAMLALGIGVNTATFTLARGAATIVQRFEDPDRLVFVWRVERRVGWDAAGWSGPGYRELLSQSTAFDEAGASARWAAYVTGDGEPVRIVATRTTANLLPMLGLEAALGRLYDSGDLASSASAVAVLTHGFWMERYGGEASVLERTVRLNDVPHTIIGVLPPKVDFEMLWRDAGIFVPMTLDPADADWSSRSLTVMARLAEGVSVERASAEVAMISARLSESRPETHAETGARIETFHDYFFSTEDRVAMLGLQLAVLAVLLIACMNLANLLMAKAVDRQGEVAIRLALGATRARMIRHLLSESLLLAFIGGAVGIVLGQWAIRLLLASMPHTPFLPEELGLDWGLFLFAFAVAVASALVFGLTPALLATRASLGTGVRESAAGASSGPRRKRFRSSLLVMQLALTVPLVATSGISYLNLKNLQATDFGFSMEGLLTARVELPLYRYPEDRQAAFYGAAVEAIGGIPGVTAAAASGGVPVGPGVRTSYYPLLVEGLEDEVGRTRGPRGYMPVTVGFFEALDVPFTAGRSITDADGANDLPVAVVNEAFARRYWPGEEAVGKLLHPDPDVRLGGTGSDDVQAQPVTVVGVVSDFGAGFHGEPPSPVVFLPEAQRPVLGLTLVVRTADDPLRMVPAVREAIRRIDPDVSVTGFLTGEGLMERWLRESRSIGAALGILALLALGIAVVGLYGMVAYSVNRRTFELGLRMALGADRWAICMAVMRSFLVLAAIGLTIGIVLSAGLGVVARSLLVTLQVSFLPLALGITLLLLVVVALATYLPARRATAIQPAVALRGE